MCTRSPDNLLKSAYTASWLAADTCLAVAFLSLIESGISLEQDRSPSNALSAVTAFISI